MTDLAKLIVRLEAQTAKYEAGMNRANRQLAKFRKETSTSLSAMDKNWKSFTGSIKGGLAAIGAAAIFHELISATSDAEFALANLENAVKNNGGAVGYTTDQLVAMSSELEQLTIYSDDAIQSMQSLLLRFKGLGGPEFDRAQRAVLDVSSALGTDLPMAAKMVGKALQDPERGMTRLARMGVSFTKDQMELAQHLMKTGHAAEAQGVILSAIEERYHGAAEAAKNTFGGALAGVKNALNNLMEVHSGLPGAVDSLHDLEEALSDPATKAAADALFSTIISGAAWAVKNIGDVVAGIATVLGATGDEVQKLENQIRFLQAERDSMLPFVLTVGKSNFDEKGGLGILTPVEIDKKIAELVAKQQKLLGLTATAEDATAKATAAAAGGAAGGMVGDPEALDKIDKLIEGLKDQIATYDMGAAAAIKYRITQGDLADTFDEAGAAAEPLKAELIDLTARYEAIQAAAKNAKDAQAAQTKISGMIDDLNQQIALLGAGEVATIQYRISTGDLADEFAKAGAAAEPYKQKLIDLTATLEAGKAAQEKAVENEKYLEEVRQKGIAVIEANRTPLEKYQNEVSDLNELIARGAIDQETYNRAIAAAEKSYEQAGVGANKFFEEATKNTQDLIAEYLVDPLGNSLEDFGKKFLQMLIQLEAQAIAANIAGKLFGEGGMGSGGIAGKGGGLLGGVLSTVFGGGKADGGTMQAGKVYKVGERGPELVYAGINAKVQPNDQIGGTTIQNNFSIQAPAGTVSRATELQIARAAARGLQASRRNG